MYIGSPDHWHALHTILSCQAGKDVYCEKPASNTVEEGRAMVTAADRYGRVVQIGSQGRSQPDAWAAANYIRAGQLGKVRKVTCWHYASPAGGWAPNSDPPPELDYESWVGPARWIPYNSERTHGRFRWMINFGGGQIRDRGAHVMSIANWIMDADSTGPTRITATGEPPHDGMYNSGVTMDVTYEFRDLSLPPRQAQQSGWTLVWAQPGTASTTWNARYGAVYWGDHGNVTVTLGDGDRTFTEQKARDFSAGCDCLLVIRSRSRGVGSGHG